MAAGRALEVLLTSRRLLGLAKNFASMPTYPVDGVKLLSFSFILKIPTSGLACTWPLCTKLKLDAA